jgi:hypothetical protein
MFPVSFPAIQEEVIQDETTSPLLLGMMLNMEEDSRCHREDREDREDALYIDIVWGSVCGAKVRMPVLS